VQQAREDVAAQFTKAITALKAEVDKTVEKQLSRNVEQIVKNEVERRLKEIAKNLAKAS
jgi:ABC-type transporter lipoprotein component MlaA